MESDRGGELLNMRPGNNGRIRVLYSFASKLGAGRTCYTAWQQVVGLANAGADLVVCPGVLHKGVPGTVKVHPTLSWGKFRISYKLVGRIRSCALHDYIVARKVERWAGQIDIIHTWPLGALRTLKTAARLGIPTVLERPNTHTRFGYTVVKNECERIGVTLPRRDEHYFNDAVLEREEQEYELASRLLCPSSFVLKSFLGQGFARSKLLQHAYGFDQQRFWPADTPPQREGLTMLFAGVCSVVKGLHFALEAWLKSPAHQQGTFLIAGKFLPSYAEKLATMLAEPSVKALGAREDVPELMRGSEVLVLPSLTEGFPLVVAEAMGSGCVPLVSEACPDFCRHMENALVHRVGDINGLADHISLLDKDPALLQKLRAGSLRTASKLTWEAAGRRLFEVYSNFLKESSRVQCEA